jgi:hypothetical protein
MIAPHRPAGTSRKGETAWRSRHLERPEGAHQDAIRIMKDFSFSIHGVSEAAGR